MTQTPPHPGDFESVGAWFSYVRQEGFNVPVQVPHAISRTQSELGLGHQEAFEWLIDQELLFALPNGFIVDLGPTTAEFWQERRE